MAQYFNILQVCIFVRLFVFITNLGNYFNLQLNAAILYPFALSFGAEALVSFKRIEEFLLKEEKNETEHGLERRSSLLIADTKRRLNL